MIFAGKSERMEADLLFNLEIYQALESRDVDYKNDALPENFLPRRKDTPFVSYRKQLHEIDDDYLPSDDDDADVESIPITVRLPDDTGMDADDVDPLG
jgi:hypothetical protein